MTDSNCPGPWSVRLLFFPSHTAPGSALKQEIFYLTDRHLFFDILLELVGHIASDGVLGLSAEPGLLLVEVPGHPGNRPILYRLGMGTGLPYPSCARQVESTDGA